MQAMQSLQLLFQQGARQRPAKQQPAWPGGVRTADPTLGACVTLIIITPDDLIREKGRFSLMNMMTIMRWFQQHNILLLLGLIVSLTGLLIIRFRRHSLYWWGAWGGLVIAVALTLFMLRTAPMSISEHSPAAIEPLEQYLNSVAEIAALVTAGEKPTLVEFYVDYGFS